MPVYKRKDTVEYLNLTSGKSFRIRQTGKQMETNEPIFTLSILGSGRGVHGFLTIPSQALRKMVKNLEDLDADVS